jgi:hypothetical protein
MGCVSLLPNSTKRLSIEYSPQDASCASMQRCPLAHIHERMCANGHLVGPVQEAPHEAQTI